MKVALFFLLINIFSIVGVFAEEHQAYDLLITQDKLVAVQVVLLIILVVIVTFLIRQEKQIKSLEDRIK
ncbi:MAG: hypothetical protein M9887_03000 [Chitinophagales bacterium]|nr:hypothetical protein [Chitinophagales bacterium]